MGDAEVAQNINDANWNNFFVEDRLSPENRSGHIAVTAGKYMIVWGGYRHDNTNDYYLPSDEIWLYDTFTDKWHLHSIMKGDFPIDLSGANAAIVNDTLYIVCGHGDGGNINLVYYISESDWEWKCIDSDNEGPSPRDKFSIWVYEKNIYIFGGFGDNINEYLHDDGEYFQDMSLLWGTTRGWNNQVLILDTETHTWSNPICKGLAPSPRAAHDSVRMGQKVYTFGGRHDRHRLNDMYCLNLQTMTWNEEIPQHGVHPEGRSWHTFTKLSDSLIFLYGGFNQHNVPLSDTWIYNVKTSVWMPLHFDHAVPRIWHTACLAPDGDVIVFGGCSNNILDLEEVTMHHNDILRFRCKPPTLLRRCLEVVVENRNRTESEWKFLPKSLHSLLKERSLGQTYLMDQEQKVVEKLLETDEEDISD